jgi:hypothetical protein
MSTINNLDWTAYAPNSRVVTEVGSLKWRRRALDSVEVTMKSRT